MAEREFPARERTGFRASTAGVQLTCEGTEQREQAEQEEQIERISYVRVEFGGSLTAFATEPTPRAGEGWDLNHSAAAKREWVFPRHADEPLCRAVRANRTIERAALSMSAPDRPYRSLLSAAGRYAPRPVRN